MKLVSVIIPVYNAELYIERCINSILNQGYKDFEIIAINDGSKDHSLDILNRLMASDKRIKVIDKKNGGVSSARNAGLAIFQGDFVIFVDADDTLCDDALSNMVSLMKDNIDFVVASHNEVRIFAKPAIQKNRILIRSDINDNFIYFDRMIWFPWAKMLRASVIRNNNLKFDESTSFGEDHIFNLLFAKKMKGDIAVSEKIVYNYNFFTGGLCNKHYENYDALQLYIIKNIEDFFEGTTLFEDKYKNYFVSHYVLGCFDYYYSNMSFSYTINKIPKTLQLYTPYITDSAYKDMFSDKELQFLKNKDYQSFLKCYILNRPKATIFHKFKHSFRPLAVTIYTKISKSTFNAGKS